MSYIKEFAKRMFSIRYEDETVSVLPHFEEE